ncbi:MAG: citramalate synthase, partial [Nitrospirota bacterium]|nr:citramalate synthase [Nitrospirota bacterium]
MSAMTKQNSTIEIYDTTLRDGSQAEDVSFSVEDKVRITIKLDELGVHFIEGGWPGANPKDIEFFQIIKATPLQQAKIVAFGSTRKAKNSAKDDPTLEALLSAETDVVTVFGKSWTLHVTEALETTLETNLELIGDSIAFLRSKGRQVFYDAEHFFDGYKTDPTYALKTIESAVKAGAERIILCDTNGGTMPWEIREMVSIVREQCSVPLGIHAHNDAEMGVANSLVAVQAGAMHVQGTINGIGERCGNANLCSIMANLELKMGRTALGEGRLRNLRTISHYVAEMANLLPNKRQPYVGDTAFAHKGGVHIHAVQKNPLTYEHVQPD